MRRLLTVRRALFQWVAAAAMIGPAALGGLDAQERQPGRREDLVPERKRATQVANDEAQDEQRKDELAKAAANVRDAWLVHDAAKIVANSPELVVQLPGADPSTAVGARQAAALLTDFLSAAKEVALAIKGVRVVQPGQGYVEMLRRYRLDGTQDVRAQSLFLGYRKAKDGWVLVELRAIEP